MKDLKFSTASKEMYGEVGNCAVIGHGHLLCNECCAAMLEDRRVMKEMVKQGKMEDF